MKYLDALQIEFNNETGLQHDAYAIEYRTWRLLAGASPCSVCSPGTYSNLTGLCCLTHSISPMEREQSTIKKNHYPRFKYVHSIIT